MPLWAIRGVVALGRSEERHFCILAHSQAEGRKGRRECCYYTVVLFGGVFVLFCFVGNGCDVM